MPVVARPVTVFAKSGQGSRSSQRPSWSVSMPEWNISTVGPNGLPARSVLTHITPSSMTVSFEVDDI